MPGNIVPMAFLESHPSTTFPWQFNSRNQQLISTNLEKIPESLHRFSSNSSKQLGQKKPNVSTASNLHPLLPCSKTIRRQHRDEDARTPYHPECWRYEAFSCHVGILGCLGLKHGQLMALVLAAKSSRFDSGTIEGNSAWICLVSKVEKAKHPFFGDLATAGRQSSHCGSGVCIGKRYIKHFLPIRCNASLD